MGGNFWGAVREQASHVVEAVAAVGEEGAAASSLPPAVQPLRRLVESAGVQKATGKQRSRNSVGGSAAGNRTSADASQYFVEYKGLDLSLLPPELAESVS